MEPCDFSQPPRLFGPGARLHPSHGLAYRRSRGLAHLRRFEARSPAGPSRPPRPALPATPREAASPAMPLRCPLPTELPVKEMTTDTDWQRKQTTDTSLPQWTDGSLALPPATADCPAAPAVHSQPAQAAHSPDNNASKQSTLAGHATTSQQPQHRLKHKHTATQILAA